MNQTPSSETTPDPMRSDGVIKLAELFGTLVVYVRKMRILMGAQALIIRKHLNITDEEWRQAVAEAESSLPADLKDSSDLEAIRIFLEQT